MLRFVCDIYIYFNCELRFHSLFIRFKGAILGQTSCSPKPFESSLFSKNGQRSEHWKNPSITRKSWKRRSEFKSSLFRFGLCSSPWRFKLFRSKFKFILVFRFWIPNDHFSFIQFTDIEFFKKVRARYYVFSGVDPSKEVLNALLEGKKTWENKDLGTKNFCIDNQCWIFYQ